MKSTPQPWHQLACIVAGYANQEQQQVIDYLRTENTTRREKLGRRRLRLSSSAMPAATADNTTGDPCAPRMTMARSPAATSQPSPAGGASAGLLG